MADSEQPDSGDADEQHDPEQDTEPADDSQDDPDTQDDTDDPEDDPDSPEDDTDTQDDTDSQEDDADTPDDPDSPEDDTDTQDDTDSQEDDADTPDDPDGPEDGAAAEEAASAGEEPVERVDPATLIVRYRLLDGPTGTVLPWSWSSLRPAEVEALVELLDGFVAGYNREWALSDADTIPPCWHHHRALAHDLSALAWAYYQAYRDPNGTPDLALRFQAHLPRFRGRIDDWLGVDPAACRDGRHSRSWRRVTATRPSADRDSDEDRDAVILLGAADFGFPP